MGVVLKRAGYFITCNGKTMFPLKMNKDFIARALASDDRRQIFTIEQDTTYRQMTLMDLEVNER
jgi:predicted DNA-binding helix-hairpin-helix protein